MSGPLRARPAAAERRVAVSRLWPPSSETELDAAAAPAAGQSPPARTCQSSSTSEHAAWSVGCRARRKAPGRCGISAAAAASAAQSTDW